MTNEVSHVASGAMNSTVQVMTGWIQLGFAGLCLFLVRAFIRQSKEHTAATVQQAVALNSNTEVTRQLSTAVQSLSDKLVPYRGGSAGAGIFVAPHKLQERSG